MKKHLQNKPDIVGLITGIQQQLTSLEKKMDAVLSRSLPRPAEMKPVSSLFPKPFQQSVNTHVQNGNRQDNRFQTAGQRDNNFQAAGRQDNHRGERVMHKAICADCRKQCEVPFMPREGRPVYCQECFSRRKSSSTFKANINNRPKEAQVPAQVTHIDKPQAGEKKKSAGKKRSVEKKRPVSKKKKSK